MVDGTVGKRFAVYARTVNCISLEQRAQNNCYVVLESFLAIFFSFEIQSQNRSFLKTLFLWPLQDGHFCHFAKSCHSSNSIVFLELFFAFKFEPRKVHF